MKIVSYVTRAWNYLVSPPTHGDECSVPLPNTNVLGPPHVGITIHLLLMELIETGATLSSLDVGVSDHVRELLRVYMNANPLSPETLGTVCRDMDADAALTLVNELRDVSYTHQEKVRVVKKIIRLLNGMGYSDKGVLCNVWPIVRKTHRCTTYLGSTVYEAHLLTNITLNEINSDYEFLKGYIENVTTKQCE